MVFSVDGIKREFSNKSKEEVIEWFNKTYDKKKAVLYYAKYKYDDVPSVLFIRSNKINGYYQQLNNKLHRLAFGVGVWHDKTLSYVWVFRGKEVPKEMKDSSYYKSCDWEELEQTDGRMWEHLYPEDGEKYVYK